MKKFYLSIFLCSLIMVMIISLLTPVVSAASVTATLTANKTTVAEGTEFMVKFKVSNIDAGNGINTIKGNLTYDTEVLEPINVNSIEGLNTWSVKFENNLITATKLAFIKNDEDVFQITFKTKSGTTGRKADIKITGISAGNAENDNIVANDISTSIVVGNESTPSQIPTVIPTVAATTPAPTALPTVAPTVAPTTAPKNNTNTNTNTNTQPNKIAYAGVEDGIVTLGFGILLIAILALWRIHSLKDIK